MLSGSARIFVLIAISLLAVGSASAGVLMFVKDDDDKKTAKHAAHSAGGNTSHPVAGDFKPDKTQLAACREPRCFEQAFGNIAYYKGPKAALQLFDEKIRNDRSIEAGCHRIAHMIGSAALARFKNNVAQAFASGSSSCW